MRRFRSQAELPLESRIFSEVDNHDFLLDFSAMEMCCKHMKQQNVITSMADAFSALVALVPNVGIWKISTEERRYRLERMSWLLERVGNPQRTYRIIHLAGTKGKGSTAAFLASALGKSGYQTGLYTSPHVSDPGERISVTTPPSDVAVLSELVREIQDIVTSAPPSSARCRVSGST